MAKATVLLEPNGELALFSVAEIMQIIEEWNKPTPKKGNEMTTEAMAMKIDEKFPEDIDRAELAGLILNSIDPKEENLIKFFETLDDMCHAEVVSRAADEDDR